MKKELLALLKPFGQEHLLAFWDELDEPVRNSLANSIRSLDFTLVNGLYENRDAAVDFNSGADRATDPPAYALRGENASGGGTISAKVPVSPEEALSAGQKALSEGKLAVVLVAGGQGTRLGFSAPKGMYPIGPVDETTLFQIHLEKIVSLAKKYGCGVPLCLMTSPATHAATIEFFERNNRFGLPEEDFFIFCQGTMPAVDISNGKVLLSSKNGIALSPNGHGGMLAAIASPPTGSEKGSILEQLSNRGIEHIFYFQVDNSLVDICSPEMIGYHVLSGSELTSQVIRKRDPGDRVGNVVQIDGRLQVIEYSDISDELANRRNPDGTLNIWAGSIAVHLMNLEFLERMAADASSLPFHIAKKKVPFICTEPGTDFGREQKPSEPNAIKFERFIFDLMPSAKNSVVVEVDIPHNYAPLKNAPGSPSDSPETVRAQLSEFHTERLRKIGAIVPENTLVEISPLFANDLEELSKKIVPGTKLEKNRENGILLR